MCFGLPQVIEHTKYQSRTEFDSAVDKVLEEFSVELICLAGFMRILSGPFVKKWEGEHSWGVCMDTKAFQRLSPGKREMAPDEFWVCRK